MNEMNARVRAMKMIHLLGLEGLTDIKGWKRKFSHSVVRAMDYVERDKRRDVPAKFERSFIRNYADSWNDFIRQNFSQESDYLSWTCDQIASIVSPPGSFGSSNSEFLDVRSWTLPSSDDFYSSGNEVISPAKASVVNLGYADHFVRLQDKGIRSAERGIEENLNGYVGVASSSK